MARLLVQYPGDALVPCQYKYCVVITTLDGEEVVFNHLEVDDFICEDKFFLVYHGEDGSTLFPWSNILKIATEEEYAN